MLNRFFIPYLLALLALPGPLWAVEAAPALTDREIVERLTRLEEGQTAIRAEMQHLRDDINTQFDRLYQLLIGLLGTFTALVLATIGFALWDRRTMLRPVEGRVAGLEEEIAGNRPRIAALLDALRTLSQRDPELAAVLKSFNF